MRFHTAVRVYVSCACVHACLHVWMHINRMIIECEVCVNGISQCHFLGRVSLFMWVLHSRKAVPESFELWDGHSQETNNSRISRRLLPSDQWLDPTKGDQSSIACNSSASFPFRVSLPSSPSIRTAFPLWLLQKCIGLLFRSLCAGLCRSGNWQVVLWGYPDNPCNRGY